MLEYRIIRKYRGHKEICIPQIKKFIFWHDLYSFPFNQFFSTEKEAHQAIIEDIDYRESCEISEENFKKNKKKTGVTCTYNGDAILEFRRELRGKNNV